MAMDPITSAALDSLVKEMLHKLQERSHFLNSQKPAERTPADGDAYLFNECLELFKMLADWARNLPTTEVTEQNLSPESGASSEMSDEEALRLLQEMDKPLGLENKVTAQSCDSIQALPQSEEEDEALKLLASMGGLSEEDSTPPPTLEGTAEINTESTTLHTEGLVEEIAEWESNEFANDPSMMQDFLTNASELIEKLDQSILQLEQDPSNKNTIEEIFRAAHTFKGAAGMFGFKAIERLMHRTENVFDLIRKEKLIANSNVVDVLFQSMDLLKKLTAAVKEGKPSGLKTAPMVLLLEKIARGESVSVVKNVTFPTSNLDEPPTPIAEKKDNKDEPSKKNESSATIRVDLERLDTLVNMIGELVIDRTRFSNVEEALKQIRPAIPVATYMTETLQLFGRHMNDIQNMIMKIRMVPIGNTFNKFPRLVRDLSRQLGKQIDLNIDGETTELDKTMVEALGDPLIHLVRNACDHGIEPPDVRKDLGKKPSGTVSLSARQEGNFISIVIEDDGKGMDADKIRAKAIEKGLISEDQNLTEKDILNLIFEPGFSTAEKVTNVSGRGVGMDVVRKQISELKGIIDLASKKGKGSTVSIQLPLTLAIVQSLIVGSGNEIFAIPLNSVVESIRIDAGEIKKIAQGEVIHLRNQVIPVIRLAQILQLSDLKDHSWYNHHNFQSYSRNANRLTMPQRQSTHKVYVVIAGSGDYKYGIAVDQLFQQQEMVIKPLGPLLKDVPCISGGAVLGNGEVILVLDTHQILDRYRMQSRQTATAI